MNISPSIVIIGSGVSGLSAGCSLLENNRINPPRVKILERREKPGRGNTILSAAKWRDNMSAGASLSLSRNSIPAYQDFNRANPLLRLHRMGYLWLMTGSQSDRNQRAIEKMRGLGIELTLYSDSDLRRDLSQLELGPFEGLAEITGCQDTQIVAGLYGHNCGSIDPVALAEDYERRFLKLGGEIEYNCKVENFIFPGDGHDPFWADTSRVLGVRARTREGTKEIRADKVLVATDTETPLLFERNPLLGTSCGLQSVQLRQLFEVETNLFDNVLGFNGLGSPFIILPWGGIYLYLNDQSRNGGNITFGCADKRVHLTSDEIALGPQADNAFPGLVMSVAQEYFPGLARAPRSGASPGHYGYSANGLPIIGEVPGVRGLYVLIGLCGKGIMWSKANGDVAAAAVMDQSIATLYTGEQFVVARLGFDPQKRDQEEEEFNI